MQVLPYWRASAAASLSNISLPCPPHACSEVEVNALLQYVANQLKSSESLDLLVLKEMVQTMTVRRGRGRAGQPALHLPAGWPGCTWALVGSEFV